MTGEECKQLKNEIMKLRFPKPQSQEWTYHDGAGDAIAKVIELLEKIGGYTMTGEDIEAAKLRFEMDEITESEASDD